MLAPRHDAMGVSADRLREMARDLQRQADVPIPDSGDQMEDDIEIQYGPERSRRETRMWATRTGGST